MRIVLLGAPGSGRRILANKLASHFGLTYVNVNHLLGEMSKEKTELGRLIGELLSACAPVPEELVASALNSALESAESRDAFIIDDYPRDVGHADALDNTLNRQGIPIDLVIALRVDADDLMERLVGKLTCDACGTEYNVYSNPPMVEGVCDMCGGRIARRPSDYEETISNRLRIFDGHAAQLIDRYRSLGILRELRGTGDDPKIFNACVRLIQEAPRREIGPAVEPGSLPERETEEGRVARVSKKTATRKIPSKKAPAKKTSAKKTPAKKAPAKKTPAKKTPAKKTPAKKTPAKKAPAKKAPAKKTPAKKAPAKKAPAKKAPAKKAPAKKAPAKKAPAKKRGA